MAEHKFPDGNDRTPNDPCVLLSAASVGRIYENEPEREYSSVRDLTPEELKAYIEGRAKEHNWDEVTFLSGQVLLKKILPLRTAPTKTVFEERAVQVLAKLCERLEKLPRIAIKDGQTFHKVDYEEVDAAMSEARASLNIPHQPVPAKTDLPWYFLKLHG